MKNRLLVLLLLFSFKLLAQNTLAVDTVYKLPEYNVHSTRINDFSKGLMIQRIDTISLLKYKSATLAEILKKETPIYIKSYGSGGLATISFRGTSSSQTGIFWNDININSPNLGMSDLSLIPLAFFNSVGILHGGASSLSGSGNIGGSIHLDNNVLFKKDKDIELGLSSGSFHNYASNLKVLLSNDKWYSSTVVIFNKNKNDYKYINTCKHGHPEERLKNAELSQYGIMQNIAGKFKHNNFFKAGFWVQKTERNIPATMTMVSSNAMQTDKVFRTTLQWKKLYKNSLFITKTAFFDEYSHYLNDFDDENISNDIDSKFHTLTSIAGIQYKYNFSDRIKINAGINTKYIFADIDDYQSDKSQKHLVGFFSFENSLKKIKWKWNVNLRQEFVETYNVPFTYSFGAEGKLFYLLSAKINVSKNFRAPTLNDLFWKPGGNENLDPEISQNQELSIIFNSKDYFKNYSSVLSCTFYNSVINDWIMWYPVSGNLWSPVNIQKVWSRGVEINNVFKFNINNLKINFSQAYTFAKTTNQKKLSANDNTYKKQLIYVPEHNANAALKIFLKNYCFEYRQNFVSKVFVTSDNQNSIDSYTLADISVSKNLEYKNHSIYILFQVKNLWNSDYQTMKYFPMPGRYFSMNLNFKI